MAFQFETSDEEETVRKCHVCGLKATHQQGEYWFCDDHTNSHPQAITEGEQRNETREDIRRDILQVLATGASSEIRIAYFLNVIGLISWGLMIFIWSGSLIYHLFSWSPFIHFVLGVYFSVGLIGMGVGCFLPSIVVRRLIAKENYNDARIVLLVAGILTIWTIFGSIILFRISYKFSKWT